MGADAVRQIDSYRILGLLGEGSFGEVYLAEHVMHKRQFAVKILRARLDQENFGDFLNEARISRLKHPNIICIQDFGIDRGIPFLVMDYVSGGTLRKHHPHGTLVPLKTIIRYVKQIAAALQYAHDDGLVHRDVKPENILIGEKGEVLVSDFGIGTTSSTWNPSQQAGVAGTPVYMAPEQINAQPVRASDQYALAAIVYEWLVGTPPFLGRVPELVIQHLTVSPPSLCKRVPSIPREIEEVVLKGLAKDPTKRFASIREFADALERASKPPIGTTLRSFKGHTNWITSVTWSPNGERVASGSSDGTVQLWDLEKGSSPLRIYRGHKSAVTDVGWSPDGSCIVSSSSDGTVQLWETTTGHRLHTYGQHKDEVLAAVWTPDGRRIVSAACETVHVWDASSGTRQTLYRRHDVCVVAWSPDGEHIASASYDATVQVREVATDNVVLTYHSSSGGGVYALAWSPDSKYIASASYDKTVQVREVATRSLLLTYQGHLDGVFALAWSPDGTRIASGGDDKAVRIWQYKDGNTLSTYCAHAQGVRCLAWSPDGQYIASGGVDNLLYVWQATR